MRKLAVLLALLVVVQLASAYKIGADNVVQTRDGKIRGYSENGVKVFRGIPFAAPPVGNLRLRVPQDPTPWNSTLDCYLNRDICPQFQLSETFFMGSEDCLYLSVYVPEKPATKGPLPVLFWIYGGAWVLGDNWEFGFYDGKNLARERDMIIVAANYRLGALGFMALDELKSESGSMATTGNYALLDQRKAMQWTQANIAAFGGDPHQVTIAGESAGAFSVCWHVASPGSRGLFRAAIMESGTCDSDYFFVDYKNDVDWSKTYAGLVGCDPAKYTGADLVKCLRGLTTAQIIGPKTQTMEEAQFMRDIIRIAKPNGGYVPPLFPVMSWGAAIDGSPYGLPASPLHIIRSGSHNRVPLVIGTNRDEGSMFLAIVPMLVPGAKLPLNDASIKATLLKFFNNNATIADAIMNAYPSSAYPNNDARMAVVLRDFFFACPSRRAALAHSSYNTNSTFMYQFTFLSNFPEVSILGVYHAAELPYVFNNEWPPIVHTFDANDKVVANTMGSYWSTFVKTQRPGNGVPFSSSASSSFLALPEWPAYHAGSKAHLELDLTVTSKSGLLDGQCQFWDNLAK